jgi:pyruvate kinase
MSSTTSSSNVVPLLRPQRQRRVRRAKIICTLGPASSSPEAVERLVAAGMDVARLNFSHGDHETHRAAYHQVRLASDKAGRAVGILADLQGPKLRLERLDGGMAALTEGQPLVIATPGLGSRPGARGVPDMTVLRSSWARISTSYAALAEDVRPGDTVLLNDGVVELAVISAGESEVECRVVRGGTIRDHSGINLPGVAVSAPTLTVKDTDDLRFALELGVDLVALSFVRAPEDADAVRSVMSDAGVHLPVIAKLERPEAVERLEEVVAAFDGIMVARGDLGVEIPLECVPLVQKRAIAQARRRAKPVIVATEMLESMVTRSRPTRAEASDVANAVLDGADALMLSAETSIGEHPVAAVTTMARIISAAESASDLGSLAPPGELTSREEAIALGAVSVGKAAGAKALVAFTQTGASARLLAAQRPDLPVLAFTPNPRVRSQLTMAWGTETFLEPGPRDTDQMIAQVDRAMLELGRAEPGDFVVVVSGSPPSADPTTNMLRVHRLGTE